METPRWPRALRHLLVLVFLVALPSGALRADVRVPRIFGDHMVLQQQTQTVFWGSARRGEEISVKASWGSEATATADDGGRWSVELATPAAGGPHTVTIQGDTRIVLDDVLVGEVWICSGQSNMEWPLTAAANGEDEIALANHPRMRLFTVKNTFSAYPRIDVDGEWTPCAPETVGRFSAVGYFFGRMLQERLGVPVGLVSADWGGTVAESWMSREANDAFGAFPDRLRYLDDVKNPDTRVEATSRLQARWWDGLGQAADGSLAPGFDDSGWKTMALPQTLGPDGLGDFDGVVYYRKVVQLAAGAATKDATLELGPIDDYDDVWVNGQHVGSMHEPGSWSVARRYPVPASALREGENVIAIRMLDTAGLGGINGRPEQMSLSWGQEAMSVAGEWRYQRGRTADKLPAMPETAGLHQNYPTVLFNGMIAPLTRFAMRGVIWYQGESNRTRAAQYRTLFPALIRDWRAQWGRGDFPFYFVQIAPYAYGGDRGQAAALREAQLMALAEPRTGMVVTTDIGNRADIHPRNKHDVGRRLARWALWQTYDHREIVPSGPLYESMTIEDDKIRLRFRQTNGGLLLRESSRSHFAIAGEDQRFVRAVARVRGDELLVSSPRVPHPVAVRYAWESAPEPNLFNRAGLPASPFRTDDWSPTLEVTDSGR